MPKPVHTPRTPRVVTDEVTERQPRGSGRTVKQFEGLMSMAWMAMGVAVGNQDRVKPDVLQPVGRVMQFQAATAGPRIKAALSKTPAWKPILAMLKHVGPWTDLVPLIGPPILVGAMAWRPELERAIMPFLLPIMMPIVQEVSDMAEEQKAMIGNIEQMQERAAETFATINAFMQGDDAINSPNGTVT